MTAGNERPTIDPEKIDFPISRGLHGKLSELLAVLKRHADREHPLPGKEICLELGIVNGRGEPHTGALRGLIAHLRYWGRNHDKRGEPIASMGGAGDGYWWTDDPDELLRTIENLDNRWMSIAAVAQALRRTMARLGKVPPRSRRRLRRNLQQQELGLTCGSE